MDRNEFADERFDFPPNQDHYTVMQYAWSRLIDGLSPEEARKFIWPWYTNEPIQGYPNYPSNILKNIRTDFDSGPFMDNAEAPGQPEEMQNQIIQRLLERNYTHWWGCITNGDTTRGRKRYSGFKNIEDLVPWLTKLANAKIVPILTPFQGAPDSWRLICDSNEMRGYYNSEGREQFGWSNEWAKDKLGGWAHEISAFCPGGWIFCHGFEFDEWYNEANEDNRGPVGKWGFGAIQETWGPVLHSQGIPLFLHYLGGHYYPQEGEGGRDWGGVKYYGGQGSNNGKNYVSGVVLQYPWSATNDQRINFTKKVISDLSPYRSPFGNEIGVYAGEYVNEGTDEQNARDIGSILLANVPKLSGVLNGVN